MSIQISKSPTLSTTGDLDVKEVREDGGKRSVNFGPGMEMFMNGKKNSRPNSEGSKSGSRGATPDIELDDIDKMEKDLTKDEPLKIQGNEGFNKVISSSNITSSLSSGRSLTPQANSGLNTRTFSGSDEQVKTQASSQEKIINLNQSSDNNQTKGSNEINKEEKLKDTKSSGNSGFMSLLGLGDSKAELQKSESSFKKDDDELQSVDIGGGSSIGKSTASVFQSKFSQFDNVDPNMSNPDMPQPTSNVVQKPERTREETIREKFKYLRKLEELEQKGVKLTKHYSMDSDLDEMIGEYEMVISEKEKSNSVKFQGKMLMAAVTGLEFLNNKVNPFDLQLDGWAESVNENIDDYDEVFRELHEKYRGKANMAPELRMLFMLGGSAVMLHMTNTMFKSSMPGMDDIMRQNPELMQQFTKAAASSMGGGGGSGVQNSGFGDFMGNMMGGGGGQQSFRPQSTPSRREEQLPKYDSPPENTASQQALNERKERRTAPREEMKGPNDLNDILSRLKPKGGLGQGGFGQEQRPTRRSSSIPDQRQSRNEEPQKQSVNIKGGKYNKTPRVRETREERSTISIQELKDAQKDIDTGRRGKSERNTVSLDI
jgi:hypothetical protein